MNWKYDFGTKWCWTQLILGFASVSGIIVFGACNKWIGVAGCSTGSGVWIINFYSIFVPNNFGQRVSTFSSANQCDCLPKSNCFALNISGYFWWSRWIWNVWNKLNYYPVSMVNKNAIKCLFTNFDKYLKYWTTSNIICQMVLLYRVFM